MANKFNACTNAVKEAGNQELLDICARRLYEMAAYTIMAQLLLQDTSKAPELFEKSLTVFVNYAESEVEKHFNWLRKFDATQQEAYKA
jgi:hypothetical protein